MSKDLRTLLGQPVKGKFANRYCGNGDLAACRASLWAALDAAGARAGGQPGARPGRVARGRHARADLVRAGAAHVHDALHEPADRDPAGHRVQGPPLAPLRCRAVRFEKWQALGNDYAIVEERELPFELTPERVRRSARRTRAWARTASCCCAKPGDARLRRRGRASSTPTAPRPSCPATACARRSCTCAATAGPSTTRSPCAPRPARSGRASPGPTPARSTWAAPACARRRTSRAAPRTARAR